MVSLRFHFWFIEGSRAKQCGKRWIEISSKADAHKTGLTFSIFFGAVFSFQIDLHWNCDRAHLIKSYSKIKIYTLECMNTGRFRPLFGFGFGFVHFFVTKPNWSSVSGLFLSRTETNFAFKSIYFDHISLSLDHRKWIEKLIVCFKCLWFDYDEVFFAEKYVTMVNWRIDDWYSLSKTEMALKTIIWGAALQPVNQARI